MALGMTVRQLLKETTARELEEWREYEQIEPFGYLAEESRFARLQCQIANMMSGKDDIRLREIDFLPNHPDLKAAKTRRNKELVTPRQSAEQMKEMLKMIHGVKTK